MKYKLKSGNNYTILYDKKNHYLFSYDKIIAIYTKTKKLIVKKELTATSKRHVETFKSFIKNNMEGGEEIE